MDDETPLERERRAKVARWRAEGREPYPYSFDRRVGTELVRARVAGLPAGHEDAGEPVRVAGRLRPLRVHGQTAFGDLEDLGGSIQLLLRSDALPAGEYDRWVKELDAGDLVGAEGTPAVSRRGEPSVIVRHLELLAKAIAPPPEKYHGLKDVEERLRHRHVDLLSSHESRQRFRAIALLTRATRSFFEAHGFLEVATSVMGRVASGAAAEPFETRSNFLDQDLQLRISLELPLKRLLVGGLERVFEIGKVFRNEDLDTTHAPEFTMLEAYWAYSDYRAMQALTEELYRGLSARAAELLPERPDVKEAAAAFARGFASVDYVDELERRSHLTGLLEKDATELRTLARAIGSTVPDDSPPGVYLDKLFEHYVEPHLLAPTFVLDHPAVTTPLARRHRTKPGRAERFELYFRGYELGNAYSELNDPDEQQARFEAQLAARPEERYDYDADFVRALRYGMPPATGLGIGIERMAMALTGAPSIKDVILFPPVRSA